MFLQDLLIRPAPRPVELGNQWLCVLNANLIDAVLIAVQRQQARVAEVAGGLDGIDNTVG